MLQLVAFLLAAICAALIFSGRAIVKNLFSISLLLTEIRDTQRIEPYRTRRALVTAIGEFSSVFDPTNRRLRRERDVERRIEVDRLMSKFEEYSNADPQRRAELKLEREEDAEHYRQSETEQEADRKRAEDEYLRSYPSGRS